MFKKKVEFSTKWKTSEIVKNLEAITKGKHLSGYNRIAPNYLGEFDNTGFKFLRSEINFLGNHNFTAKFIESEFDTKIMVSIQPSLWTFIFYFFIEALIFLSLFLHHINFNAIKIIVLILLFVMPILILYLSFREDVKKANNFLMNFFKIKESLLFKNKRNL